MQSIEQRMAEAYAAHGAGTLAEAERLYRDVLSREPGHAEATHYLGLLAVQRNDAETAQELLARSIELAPQRADFLNNIARLLSDLGRAKEALPYYRRALAVQPDFGQGWLNLGAGLYALGKIDEAVEAYTRAATATPEDPAAHYDLGLILYESGETERAITQLQRCVSLDADFAAAHYALGVALMDVGELPRSLDHHRRAVELDDSNVDAYDSLLLAMHYDAGVMDRELFEAHVEYGRRFGKVPLHGHRPTANSRDPERRLRVGFVSPDFCHHVVALFIEPVLTHLDRKQFEVFCYSATSSADEMTEHLRGLADAWRDGSEMDDDAFAEMVRADRIDILVDLAGHTAGNRLGVLARKPAPVQVTQFGYPNTSGLAAVDYRVTDELSDPPGADEMHVERLVRLPRAGWCYRPLEEGPPIPPEQGPAVNAGQVTFGCLNNPLKLSPPAIKAMAEILRRVPDARLMLRSFAAEAGNRRVRECFACEGIGASRLNILPRQTRSEYLKAHEAIDVALDPFPYNGAMTTCDALWMGVAVVTLAGRRYASRQGVMLLTNAGLTELIARDAAEYVQIATTLATDRAKLTAIRRGLRERFAASAMMDSAGYARELGEAYRAMWRNCCGGIRT